MATKLQHSINPLPTPINSNIFPANSLDGSTWDCFQSKRLKQKQQQQQQHQQQRTVVIRFEDSSPSTSPSMDRNRMIERQNQEYIKKTMQMQDSIFQHQVRELHRVYNVQKMLINELRNEAKQNQQSGPMASPNSVYSKTHFQNVMTERSGSCSGGETARMSKKGFDLEIPPREGNLEEAQAGPSSYNKAMNIGNSHSNTNDCGGPDDNDLELTLSLGGTKNNSVMKRKVHERNPELGFESGSNNSSSSSSARLENHQQPRWLFQSLNLNKT